MTSKSLVFCNVSTLLNHFPRFYHSGQNKPSKPSGPGKAQAQVPESTLRETIAASSTQRAHTVAVDQATQQVCNGSCIPSEVDVLNALLHCDRAASFATNSSTTQPTGQSVESETAASSLLSLDGSMPDPPRPLAAQVSSTSGPSDFVDHISQVAFEIIAHPLVVITERLLDAYVVIQSRLGRPETLPHALSLYASKPRPKPREIPGSFDFVAQDPHRAAAAVPSNIVEKALDGAIDAKSLDAAVGIVESTYATKAFATQKLLRRALVPASLAATAPVAVYLAASHLAVLQTSLDHKTATVMAAAGMLAYVGFTGSMGLLAVLTANDQMSRVTWAPGIKLRERWLREESRAAYDRVACSFGFSQSHRFGEEEGEEFASLRQYLLRKGMVLDSVQLMEGMA